MKLSTRQRGLVNVAGIAVCRGVVMVITLLLVPFLIRHLGKEGFGIYRLVRSFIGYMPLFTLAIMPALSRYVTHAVGRDDREGVNRYMSTGLAAMGILSILLILAGVVLSLLLPSLVDLGNLVGQSQILLALLVMGMGINYASSAFGSALYAREMLAESSAVETITDILSAILIVAAFTLLSTNLAWVGVAAVVGVSVTGIVRLIWAYRVFPWLRISFRLLDRSSLGELLSFSMFSTIGVLTRAIYFSTDNFIIKGLYGPAGAAMITVYSVGIIWDGWIRAALTPLLRVVYPRMTLFSSQDHRADMRRLVLIAMRYSTAIMIPVCLFMSFFGKPILTLWVGSELGEADVTTAAGIIPIVLVPLFVALGAAPSQAVFVAEGKLGVPAFVGITGALVNLVLSVVLAKNAGWGLYGVAAGTGITFFLRAVIFVPYYLKRLIQLRLREFYLRGVLRPYVLGLLYAGVCWFILVTYEPRTVVELMVSFLVSAILYSAGTWIIILLPGDRRSVMNWVGRIVKLVKPS